MAGLSDVCRSNRKKRSTVATFNRDELLFDQLLIINCLFVLFRKATSDLIKEVSEIPGRTANTKPLAGQTLCPLHLSLHGVLFQLANTLNQSSATQKTHSKTTRVYSRWDLENFTSPTLITLPRDQIPSTTWFTDRRCLKGSHWPQDDQLRIAGHLVWLPLKMIMTEYSVSKYNLLSCWC